MPFVSSDSIESSSNPVAIKFPDSEILGFDSITAVTDNTKTTCLSYTASGNVNITKIIVTGDANATWTVEIDSDENFEWRVADGNKTRTENFVPQLVLASGSTIDIKVQHFFTGETANFKSTLIGFT